MIKISICSYKKGELVLYLIPGDFKLDLDVIRKVYIY